MILTWPDEDKGSAHSSLKSQLSLTVPQLTNKLTLPITPHKTSKLYQQSVNQATKLLRKFKALTMVSSSLTLSTILKVPTINSLANISDDEEILAPLSALSATVTEMQVKADELNY